jgi:hypothetical protein
MVVHERKQQRFATADFRAMRDVADPQIIDRGSLEPAEHLRRTAVRTDVQAQPGEMALHGPLRGDVTLVALGGELGDQQLRDVSGRPGRVLPLELDRKLEQRNVTAQLTVPFGRDQPIEPARYPTTQRSNVERPTVFQSPSRPRCSLAASATG